MTIHTILAELARVRTELGYARAAVNALTTAGPAHEFATAVSYRNSLITTADNLVSPFIAGLEAYHPSCFQQRLPVRIINLEVTTGPDGQTEIICVRYVPDQPSSLKWNKLIIVETSDSVPTAQSLPC